MGDRVIYQVYESEVDKFIEKMGLEPTEERKRTAIIILTSYLDQSFQQMQEYLEYERKRIEVAK